MLLETFYRLCRQPAREPKGLTKISFAWRSCPLRKLRDELRYDGLWTLRRHRARLRDARAFCFVTVRPAGKTTRDRR